MLTKNNLDQFTKLHQTTAENVIREYCQHLFLSYLYQQQHSEKLLFKDGTALRIVYQSPRFSEDLDFTGTSITAPKVEMVFADTLAKVEKTGIPVELIESKKTSGGYLGLAIFSVYDTRVQIQIEVSLRESKRIQGDQVLIVNEFIPAYTLVQLPEALLVEGKLAALFDRKKPRDFYDLFFLLSGNFKSTRNTKILRQTLDVLQNSKLDFQRELKKFLPASQSRQLRDFRTVLKQKIQMYLK